MQPKKKTPWALIIGLTMAGVVAMVFMGGLLLVSLGGWVGSGEVAVIYVMGPITGGGEGVSLLGGAVASAETLVRRIDKARKDPMVKAVVLRVDSPGGTVAASQEIYDAIVRFRRSRKKIVTSMSDVAASGAYYLAAATDKIVAQRGTLTGSIGVIMGVADYEGLMRKLGVRDNTIKSGKRKDIGSPFRAMTAEERKDLQATSDEVHEQFIRDVANGRSLPVAEVRKIADGSIYTGERALKLKLIDQLGGLHDAVREAAKLAGIKGEPRVVRYGRGVSIFDLFFGGAAESIAQRWRQTLTGPVIRALAPAQPLPAWRAW